MNVFVMLTVNIHWEVLHVKGLHSEHYIMLAHGHQLQDMDVIHAIPAWYEDC